MHFWKYSRNLSSKGILISVLVVVQLLRFINMETILRLLMPVIQEASWLAKDSTIIANLFSSSR